MDRVGLTAGFESRIVARVVDRTARHERIRRQWIDDAGGLIVYDRDAADDDGAGVGDGTSKINRVVRCSRRTRFSYCQGSRVDNFACGLSGGNDGITRHRIGVRRRGDGVGYRTQSDRSIGAGIRNSLTRLQCGFG